MDSNYTQLGCSDGYCKLRIGPDPGMHTNGGCRCLQNLPTKKRLEVERKLHHLQAEVERLTTERNAALAEFTDYCAVPRRERDDALAENERLRTLLSEWVADADSGELDGVDLELMVMTDDTLAEKHTTGCPGCGGPTQYSRELPPSPYYCDECNTHQQPRGEEE